MLPQTKPYQFYRQINDEVRFFTVTDTIEDRYESAYLSRSTRLLQ